MQQQTVPPIPATAPESPYTSPYTAPVPPPGMNHDASPGLAFVLGPDSRASARFITGNMPRAWFT